MRVLLLAALGTLSFAANLHASPYHATLTAPRIHAAAIKTDHTQRGVVVTPIDPITIRTRVPSLGAVVITLSEQRVVNWKSQVTGARGISSDSVTPILLRGTYRSARRVRDTFGDRPIAASIINNQLTLSFVSSPRGAHRKVFRYIEVRGSRGALVNARVRAIPSTFVASKGCGAPLPAPRKKSAAPRTAAASARALNLAEISTDTDVEFFQEYGASSNAEIAAIIDAVDTIYQRDLNIDLSILQQNTFSSSSPYTATTSNAFLTSFRNYTNTNQHLGAADVFHCFSGKAPFSDGPAGLAYIGVVCFSPDYAYGISQDYGRAVNTVLVAHEVGHNFGADHDNSSQGFIMNPVASGSYDEFSSLSKSVVAEHIANYGSCLGTSSGDDNSPTPTPTPSAPDDSYTITIRSASSLGRCTLTARVRDGSDHVSSGVSVNFYKRNRRTQSDSLIASKASNARGVARQTRVTPGTYVIELADVPEISGTIRCRR